MKEWEWDKRKEGKKVGL
jgi:hypothetical protein